MTWTTKAQTRRCRSRPWSGQYIPMECQEFNRLRGKGANQVIEDLKEIDRFTAQQGPDDDSAPSDLPQLDSSSKKAVSDQQWQLHHVAVFWFLIYTDLQAHSATSAHSQFKCDKEKCDWNVLFQEIERAPRKIAYHHLFMAIKCPA